MRSKSPDPEEPWRRLPPASLSTLPEGVVIVCPSKPAGVDWMLRYYAWGYIRISRRPRYFALYVSDSIRCIRFFGQVDRTVEPSANDSPVRGIYTHDTSYRSGKKVLLLVHGSLSRLPRDIPLGSKKHILQSPKYYTLSSLRNARSMDDLQKP